MWRTCRDDGAAVAEPRRLGEPARRLGHLTYLATQADLAEDDHVAADRCIVDGADDRQGDSEVAARLGEASATDGGDVHVVARHRQSGAALDDGKEHRQATGVETVGVAPPLHALWHRHRERLHFDEQRAFAFEDRNDDRAGDTPTTVGEEEVGRIGYADESGLGHLEQPELARRPEPVLDGAQQSKGVVTFPFEREHRVDGVFELTRSGQRAVLGDVADEDDGDAATLGLDDELLRARAHLCRSSPAPRLSLVGDRLNAVDDDEFGGDTFDGIDDAAQRRLGGDPRSAR